MSGDDGQDSGRQGRRQRDHGFPFSIFITPVQMQRPEPAAFTPPTGAAAVFSAASVAPAAAVAPAAVVVPAEAVVPAAAPDPREPTPQVRRGRGGISFRAAPDRRNYPSSTMESINSERVLAVSSRVIVTAPISPPMPRAAGNAPASSAEATAPLDLCNGHNIWDNHFTSGQRTWSQFGGQTLDEEPATAAPALDPVASSASSTAAAAASPVPSRQNVSNSDDSSFSIPQMSWGPSGGFYRELEDDAPRRTRRPAPRRVAPPLSHSTLGTSRRGNSAFWDYYNVVRERSPLGSSNRESINRAPRSSAAASVNIAAATSNVPRQHGPMPGTRETSGDNTDVLRGGATAAAADVPQLSSSLATVHVDGRSSSDLEDDLECYVCTEMRRGAQYLCENGHPLCHFCLSKLPNATCPMARTCGFTIPPKRNYELEEKIRRFWRDNNLKFECHWDNCTLVFKDEKQLAKHERGCTKGAKIRRYHCPAPVELCGQMFLTRRELRRHSRGCQRIVAENSKSQEPSRIRF